MTQQRVPGPIVAIPVRNEADRIADCLRALAFQHGTSGQGVLLLLNNCTDDTAGIVRDMLPALPITVRLEERSLPPDLVSAGQARRLAMELAVAEAGDAGVVLTTDADGRVAPDWIAANLHHLRRGAEAVMGRAVIDPLEAALLPDRLHADDRLECGYAALLDEVTALLDPDPADPWPRHDERSGASMAVTVAAYRRAGGLPAVPMGEDRAFHDALCRVDARIRHAPEVCVTVSGRLHGRAVGGMADTMRRRLDAADEWLDNRLDTAAATARRARLRARARSIWRGVDTDPAAMRSLADDLGCAVGQVAQAMRTAYFGEAWWIIERCSPTLARRRVPVGELAQQTDEARSLRDALSDRGGPAGPTGSPARDLLAAE